MAWCCASLCSASANECQHWLKLCQVERITAVVQHSLPCNNPGAPCPHLVQYLFNVELKLCSVVICVSVPPGSPRNDWDTIACTALLLCCLPWAARSMIQHLFVSSIKGCTADACLPFNLQALLKVDSDAQVGGLISCETLSRIGKSASTRLKTHPLSLLHCHHMAMSKVWV